MEKAYFPMPTLTITQGYDEGTHKGAYALDCAGEDAGIDWVHAPFTGIIRSIDKNNGNFVWLESKEPVLYADGTVDYMTMMFGHCNFIDGLYEGKEIHQGDKFYAEGTAGNTTGNHVHIECGRGKYIGKWYKNSDGVWMIYNAIKPNEVLCLKNDTVIRETGTYSWKKENEVKETISTNKQKLYLPSSADTWRVYPIEKQPVVGNECGTLLPSKFGGLEYDILDWSMNNVAIIQTRDYGKVQIYVAPETGAIIK